MIVYAAIKAWSKHQTIDRAGVVAALVGWGAIAFFVTPLRYGNIAPLLLLGAALIGDRRWHRGWHDD